MIHLDFRREESPINCLIGRTSSPNSQVGTEISIQVNLYVKFKKILQQNLLTG